MLNVGNGQTARLGHGETAGGLRRLGREEETLGGGVGGGGWEEESHTLITFSPCDSARRPAEERPPHLAALFLPEDGRLRVASGLALEDGHPARRHHLVPGPDGESWGNCRGKGKKNL